MRGEEGPYAAFMGLAEEISESYERFTGLYTGQGMASRLVAGYILGG